RCYEHLVAKGWPEDALPSAAVRDAARLSVEAACAEVAAERGTGYALLWEMIRETVTELVSLCVQADQEDYRQSRFKPIAFELEAQGRLDDVGTKGRHAITVKGRLDRVDRRDDPPALRIIDYKVKVGSGMKSEDHHLL